MANSEMSMESIDSGSNYSFGDKMIKANAPKAAFNLSNLSTMTINNAGIVFPICKPIETIMGDDFDISIKTLLRVLPQEIPLYSRQRLYIYAFYCRNSDLWKNWNVFMRKGNTGNVIKEIPTLNENNLKRGSETELGTITNESLGELLGLPIGLDMTEWKGKITALPFFMYLKIWRDYFCNKNQFINNKSIFPDNDDDFRLDDDGQIISCKEYGKVTRFKITNKNNSLYGIDTNNNTEIKESTKGVIEEGSDIEVGLFYHNYPDDRFTDALPWPIRGEEPTINLNINFNGETETKVPVHLGTDVATTSEQNILGRLATITMGGSMGGVTDAALLGTHADERYGHGDQSLNQVTLGSGVATGGKWLDAYISTTELANAGITTGSTGISLNMIRELAIKQTELEKMAKTDGTYLGFAMTFFGEKPKNAEDYRPYYIGGTYTDITFTEVLQTSSTANETSPLGTYAGHGIAVNNDGYIGHVHCDDYGWIMILGCIMPDVYYAQGVGKELTRHLQSDYYLPERAKMGMIPILNHEVYALNKGNDFKKNFDMFAWNNPFDELRYRANEIHGKIADPENASFSNYTQARFFNQKPNWGKEFSEASEVSKNYLSAGKAEVAYTAQFKIDINAVRAIPYKAIPAQII